MPALVFGVVVAASAVVRLWAIQPSVAIPLSFAAATLEFLRSGYFRGSSDFGAIPSAAFILEGVGLFAAAMILAGREKKVGRRLLAMAVCGAVGVAMLSLARLMTVTLRYDDAWAALLRNLSTLRVSAAFPDPNAAGSYFAMALLVAAGLALNAYSSDGDPGDGGGRLAKRRPALARGPPDRGRRAVADRVAGRADCGGAGGRDPPAGRLARPEVADPRRRGSSPCWPCCCRFHSRADG